jgi:NAD/NADP transhydrogenase beta subunit
MRILDADKADITMVVKRSMSPASSAPTTLSILDHTLMLFGDAKGFVNDIVRVPSKGGDIQ